MHRGPGPVGVTVDDDLRTLAGEQPAHRRVRPLSRAEVVHHERAEPIEGDEDVLREARQLGPVIVVPAHGGHLGDACEGAEHGRGHDVSSVQHARAAAEESRQPGVGQPMGVGDEGDAHPHSLAVFTGGRSRPDLAGNAGTLRPA